MNDLHFIKYIPKNMMLDTFGMSVQAKVAHRQLFDMTIINDGPAEDKDEVLRELASCPKPAWPKVKEELLKKGYKSTGGYFLHGGTIKTLNESKIEFVKAYNRTASANHLKKLVISEPDSVTGCVTYRVTSDVTHDVSPPVTPTQTDRRTDGQPQSPKDTTKLPTSVKSRSKFSERQTEITARFDKALGVEWENDRQKWMGIIANSPALAERVVAEVENAIKEGRIKKTPAAYAHEIWKEFK